MSVQEVSEDADWNVFYIDGEWVTPDDRDTIDVENPATREKFAEVPAGQPEDVDRAYEAAEEAQKEWAEWSYEERAEELQKVIDALQSKQMDISNLLAIESGSATPKAMAEIQTTRADFEEVSTLDEDPHRRREYDSQFAGKENFVQREPVGVVGVIIPWNFPLHMATRSVAPALAFGNSVVVKPPSETPITAGLAIASLIEETDIPDGVFNVVTGKGSDIGDEVAGHPKA
ncbi:MAG: aldehyde dehydrogenase family protein, partial [Halobacteria archaeon]|nr:aldehyde dehydrogenase family protein [Halobacteria archaeon]